MKKLLSVISAAALCAVPYAGYVSTAANADTRADVIIAASDELPCNDIFEVTKGVDSDMWTYTMIYDRLFEMSADGESIEPSLAVGYTIGDSASGYSARSKNAVARALRSGIENPFYDYDPAWEDPYEDSDPYSEGNGNYLGGDGPLVLTIQLRDDVLFTDGYNLTSEDVGRLISFAQGLPDDTLLYKQWAPVKEFRYIDDQTFELELGFSTTDIGYMDFMYGMASPMGSIVKPPEYEWESAIGTGAYKITDASSKQYVMFERNDDWWNGIVPSQTIEMLPSFGDNLQYVLGSGDIDIGYASKAEYDYWYYSSDYGYNYIIGNPIILRYNLDKSYFADDYLRKAIDYAINNDIISHDCLNATEANNDYWTYAARYDPFNAKDPLVGAVTELKVLGNEKYSSDLQVLQNVFEVFYNNKLESYYGHDDYRINMSANSCSEDELKEKLKTGDYDIYFEEIDLCDANAMIKNFGNLDSGCEEWADKIKRSADYETYKATSESLLTWLYENAYISYLGWDSGVIVRRQDVYGFDAPTGSYPFGDTSRLDFRYVYK